jgi:hypothetical protein
MFSRRINNLTTESAEHAEEEKYKMQEKNSGFRVYFPEP